MAEIRKRKSTLLHFWAKQTKTDDENNNKCTENIPSKNSNGPPKESTDTDAGTSDNRTRTFQSVWLQKFTWLRYDSAKSQMFCETCKNHNKQNTLTEGSSNFRTSTLTRHAESKDHVGALMAVKMQPEFSAAVQNVVNTKEEGIVVAMKSVYWLAKENLPMHKYGSLVQFLSDVECKSVSNLPQAKNATYTSETSANDMLQSIAASIRANIDTKLQKSPFVSVFGDESTDIGCQKKLVIFARVLDTESFTPSTHYLGNVKVPDGTGKVVSKAILDCLADRNVSMSSVMGFGSDGAKAMTGTREGVTGHLLRQNPMLLNFHCIAHRLALVSSQAAMSIPYLKEYQETLTGMFYFFKASANRCQKLQDIQALLEEPQLKITEVHEVRWMSIYKAVETVYRCLDSLITVFSTETDAKAKGYGKKIGNTDFISTTYMLMDILPVITELCLVFQKTDLDVSLVEVSVENCKRTLLNMKTDSGASKTPKYLDVLKEDLKQEKGKQKLTYKGNHVVTTGHRNIERVKDIFIDKLIENLDERFPVKDSNIMYSYGVLGMRPISFLSKKELSSWGNDKLETLIDHFGQEQKHSFGDETKSADPVINAEETRNEWDKLKHLVVNNGYPRDKLCVLWGLINKYHSQEFPNMMKLSALALTAPIHTADCERGFSLQNITKTALRSRLCPERVNDLITVAAEGGPLAQFDFQGPLKHWKDKKQRRLYSA